MELVKGSHVRVVTAESEKDKTDGNIIWVDYSSLPKVVQKGNKIYIDDGLIALKVLQTGDTQYNTRDHFLPCFPSFTSLHSPTRSVLHHRACPLSLILNEIFSIHDKTQRRESFSLCTQSASPP